MYTLRIKITKEILLDSMFCQKSNENCAFARAVRDIFPSARVGRCAMFPFDPYDIDLIIFLPKEMQIFIDRFDHMPPRDIPSLPEQEFDLPIPDWVIERINIDELKPLLASHPNLSLVTI